MCLEGALRQMSGQLELPPESRGEAPRVGRSGEAPSAARGTERSGGRRRPTSTFRTAGYGPVRAVVWEGCSRWVTLPATPYPD